jgi:DNA-binding response OmpR family regulator
MDGATPRHVLVVHGEPATRRQLRDALLRESYAVSEASSPAEAVSALQRQHAEVVVLGLGEADAGFEVFAALKDAGAALLCISEGGGEAQVVAALRAGADACIAAPLSVAELVARVGALLRRTAVGPGRRAAMAPPADVEVVGELRLDRGARTVFVGTRELSLGAREFDLLSVLLSQPGRVLSRQQLISAVWGEGHNGEPKTVDVHVHHLRAKLATVGDVPVRIATVSRVGYRLDRLRR